MLKTSKMLDVLIAARALIADNKNWCKHQNKMITKNGTAYCARGALFEVDKTATYINDLITLLNLELPEDCEFIVHFNDRLSTTHSDILQVFDKAIEKLANTG